ncbi:Lectin C-type domain protein [Planctomycetes bacterium MalM25]|nr:Lectin C-type domain protein [Planctomycetes bacterium MalM25]
MRLPIAAAVIATLLISACQVDAGLVIAKTAVNPTNGHTYHLLHGDGINQVGLSWTEAETEALQLGGHLVAINDLAEQEWIVDTFPGQPQPGGVSDSYHLWIGLNDAADDGTFVWSNGDPVTYTRWNPGEPNNFGGDEDYVHFYNFANGAFEWNDAPDVRLFPSSGGPMSALVEVVPEPSSLVGVGLVVVAAISRSNRRELGYLR